MKKNLQWSGRHLGKDELRSRVWELLEQAGVAVGNIRGSIPNFKGAEEAADYLASSVEWKEAKIIKSNPDDAQIPVRLRALRDGKMLYMPVPELTSEYPFLELVPEDLLKQGVSFEYASTIPGALKYGRRLHFEEMKPMDLLVVGCVAVAQNGGRTGKGAGFADIELGIFNELSLIPSHATIATTVHDLQIVESAHLPLEPHDSVLNLVATPTKICMTDVKPNQVNRPGINWNLIRPEQMRTIPALERLKKGNQASSKLG